jgi:hypothetical protein
MTKKHKHTDLSTKTCAHRDCSKHLKQRLVEEKPTVSLCYLHYREQEAGRSHFIDMQPRKKRIKAGLPVRDYV